MEKRKGTGRGRGRRVCSLQASVTTPKALMIRHIHVEDDHGSRGDADSLGGRSEIRSRQALVASITAPVRVAFTKSVATCPGISRPPEKLAQATRRRRGTFLAANPPREM